MGPVVITRGDGSYVFDDQGNRYIEGLSGLFCASLGFSEARLVEPPPRGRCSELPYSHYSFGHRRTSRAIELAERLICDRADAMSKVLFANSGSEANDTAIKLVMVLPQRHRQAGEEENHLARQRPITA